MNHKTLYFENLKQNFRLCIDPMERSSFKNPAENPGVTSVFTPHKLPNDTSKKDFFLLEIFFHGLNYSAKRIKRMRQLFL